MLTCVRGRARVRVVRVSFILFLLFLSSFFFFLFFFYDTMSERSSPRSFLSFAVKKGALRKLYLVVIVGLARPTQVLLINYENSGKEEK